MVDLPGATAMKRFAVSLTIGFLTQAGLLLAANWPVFRGDALMSGVGHAQLPEQLQERWTFKARDSIEGAPAIVDGVVYVASFDKHVYALDLATGRLKWKSEKLGPFKASPAVQGQRLYVGDLNGSFYCLDVSDGHKLWQFDTDGEIHAGANFHGPNILVGSHDSNLYCLSPEGKKLWSLQTDGPVNGSPAVIGDTTFVAGCDSLLHIVDARTGKDLGNVDLGGQAGATAAIAGDFAYVGTMSNQVVAVNWKEQSKVWEFEAPRRQQPFYASAAVADGIVVTASRDKKVYALEARTGKELWNFVTEGQVDASPVVVNGRVYIGCLSNEGEFYVLDLKTGKKIQQLDLDSAVTGSVAVGPDCLVVATEKGTVYCLGGK